MEERNELWYINNGWFLLPVFICITHGTYYLSSSIVQENRISPSNTDRQHIRVGLHVLVHVDNQPVDTWTEGYVKEILTKSPYDPRGIKVELKDGQVGRVQDIIP